MNAIGTIEGLLSVSYKNSGSIFTILLDPKNGEIISFLVDDGEDVREFNLHEKKSSIEYGTDPLQWGLFA
ncbi:MAG TPA: hypothetical protein VK172_04020 [Lentimicrobium sp.]|nr:hypothetical protein [Lentimicrobium sp.]